MHALLLSLALGQVEAVPPAPPAAPPAAPAPAIVPAATPPATTGGPPLRAVDLARGPDGTFRATLDGAPVAGADFYRAVLRPDLAARNEEARFDRAALLIAAAAAPVFGLGIGWVAGTAQQWPLPPCVGVPPGPVNCAAHDQVAAQNTSAMNTALVAGAVGGVVTGVALWLAGASIHPVEPTADEAEALLRAYRARGAPVAPAAPPAAPAPEGATLRLEAGPQAVRLALRLAF